MISFKPAIRSIKSDGFAVVYVRVTKDRKIGYLKTQFVVNPDQHNGREVTDYSILAKVYSLINGYYEKTNNLDIEKLSVEEIINEISGRNNEISFTDFCDEYIKKMINDGREKSSRNYKSAVNSFKSFSKKENINFSDINSKTINSWIDSLRDKKRAKSLYPNAISTIFNAGLLEYNDYDKGILKITHQPFMHVKIPKQEEGEKRAISKEELIKIFSVDLESNKYLKEITTPLAKDISLIVFCLIGINTVDLYHLKKENFKDGKICYNRRKTKDRRSDKAYIEISVPEIIYPLFEKYKGSDKLFSFCEMYSTADSFQKYANEGLLEICRIAGVNKATIYTFRHSWATIAQNNCGASDSDVAFALNHSSDHKITRGYIKIDYSPIDILNKKVLEYVFDTNIDFI